MLASINFRTPDLGLQASDWNTIFNNIKVDQLLLLIIIFNRYG